MRPRSRRTANLGAPPRALLHDEERYPDPDTFKPSRFLTTEGVWNPDVPDPIETFGFGRRICPGRHFALDAVFLSVSNVLAAFTMDKAVDDQGKVIEPTSEYTSRLFWCVLGLGFLQHVMTGTRAGSRSRTKLASRHVLKERGN